MGYTINSKVKVHRRVVLIDKCASNTDSVNVYRNIFLLQWQLGVVWSYVKWFNCVALTEKNGYMAACHVS